MKIFLVFTAIVAWLLGIAQLVAPETFYAREGIVLTGLQTTVAQILGATLIGLGVINWLTRKADNQGLLAVLWGNLVLQAVSTLVTVRTWSGGAGKEALPALVIHAVLALLFLLFLFKARRSAAAQQVKH